MIVDQIEIGGVIFRNPYSTFGSANANFALEHRDSRIYISQNNSGVGWLRERDLFARKRYVEDITFGSKERDVGGPLLQMDRGDFRTRIAKREFRNINFASRS